MRMAIGMVKLNSIPGMAFKELSRRSMKFAFWSTVIQRDSGFSTT